jgi:hypothetical protein
VQSQQLPTESQVFKDEVPAGTESSDHPAEEMPELGDEGKNLIETLRIHLLPSHSFCRCTTFWQDTGHLQCGF